MPKHDCYMKNYTYILKQEYTFSSLDMFNESSPPLIVSAPIKIWSNWFDVFAGYQCRWRVLYPVLRPPLLNFNYISFLLSIPNSDANSGKSSIFDAQSCSLLSVDNLQACSFSLHKSGHFHSFSGRGFLVKFFLGLLGSGEGFLVPTHTLG